MRADVCHVCVCAKVSFFTCMILHRSGRDYEKWCALLEAHTNAFANSAHKYGDDWTKYTRKVPWRFVPGVF